MGVADGCPRVPFSCAISWDPYPVHFVVGRSADWGGTNLPEPARGDDLADLLVFSCVCSFLEILTRVMCAIRLFARAQG